jgi:hypothetical protein
VLQAASPLGWTLFEAHCKRSGIAPEQIRPRELLDLLPQIRRALSRFSSESRAEDAIDQLRRLAERDSHGDGL